VEELDRATNGHGATRVAFAIGDSYHDHPMRALADRAFAPSNATRSSES
jgi:predicted mannosyl-3-phosphoglycerate phosphatase (HAD superfamily)